MKKIRAMIVDDEPLARERIRKLLEDEEDFELIGACSDGMEAVIQIEKLRPDLIFLDVQMPEMDGFEVLEAVDPDAVPVVIFVTAYDKHALKAFDFHALDYLLKPFDKERFRKAVRRASGQIRKSESMKSDLQALLKHIRPEKKYLERMVIKTGGRIFFLKTDDIEWIEAAGNYLNLHAGGETHLVRETMNAIESKLDPATFIRIHRSTIVHIERIKELQPLFNGEFVVVLRDHTKLTLSKTYRNKLPEALKEAF